MHKIMEHEPDPRFMKRAIELALEAVSSGTGGPFGALVVRTGEVLGEGQNRVLERLDPTAHAEVEALRAAAQRSGSPHLVGAELYTSCEPCPMCLAAAHWARVERIWFSGTTADAERAGFDDQLFFHEFSLPPEQRRIQARPFMPSAAEAAFEAWVHKPDKQSY